MKPEPKAVGWETKEEWELEMRCANITENTPFDEVSKLINDLWQQYCLAAEPKGVARQVHHSKPVVSQNTQIVGDNATEGGAHEKELRKALEDIARDGRGFQAIIEDHTDGSKAFYKAAYEYYRNQTVWRQHTARAALTAKQTDGREGE